MKDGVLRLLFVCNGIFVLAASLFGPLYAVYVQRLGHGNGILTISTTWSVFLFATTFFTWLISRIGDKIPKEDLLVAGFLLRAFVWLAYIFITNIPELIVLQILLGLGDALGSPSFDAIFAEHLDKNVHVREYADWHLISNIVSGAGTVLGGVIVTKFGFPLLFIVMAIFALLSTVGVLSHPRRIHMN